MSPETASLLARLRGFLLPEGDAAARDFETVRIFEKGEMRFPPVELHAHGISPGSMVGDPGRSVLLLPERGDAMRAGSLIPTTP